MEDRPLVQWSFFQIKKNSKKDCPLAPVPCFLHSVTQIGSKILLYGGCNYSGEALNQMLLYDTSTFQFVSPSSTESDFQEDHPGSRYGHSAVLVEMHPPKIMVYGGIVGGGTFEFDAPDTLDQEKPHSDAIERTFMSWRRKGRKAQTLDVEETDSAVYFLSLNSDRWVWSKPIIHTPRADQPSPRLEHTATKTATNEVTVFGGWTDRPMNDMWIFNVVDMEWSPVQQSGILPKPRYRHTCECIGRSLYILGGSDNGQDIAEANMHLGIHQFDLSNWQWSHPTLHGINPFPRSGHGSCVIGAKTIAIFGGKRNDETYFNDMIFIDTDTLSTTLINAVEGHLPSPITNATLTSVGNRCFVFGGTDLRGDCYNDVRLLDIGYYLNANDVSVGQGASSDYNFKLIIIGDAAVGKSAILTRFSENVFLDGYSTTIGIDFNSRMIRVDRAICKLEIWDTAGQERFSTITANYYRGAQGALLVYDVSLRESFDRVKVWFERAKQLGGEHLIPLLIGNKCDLPEENRQVSTAEGQLLAQELNIPFIETSALNGYNVEAAFVQMTREIKKSVDQRGLSGVPSSGSASLKRSANVQLASKERGMSITDRCGCGSK